MIRLWRRGVGWVRWRWNLPAAHYAMKEMYFGLGERCAQLERRCEEAEAKATFLERRAVAQLLPGLSAAEIERLAILAEECGEVVQAVGKVLRHGWDSQSPFGGVPNRNALERELGDVAAVRDLMQISKDVRANEINTRRWSKRGSLPRWVHHQSLEGLRTKPFQYDARHHGEEEEKRRPGQ